MLIIELIGKNETTSLGLTVGKWLCNLVMTWNDALKSDRSAGNECQQMDNGGNPYRVRCVYDNREAPLRGPGKVLPKVSCSEFPPTGLQPTKVSFL